MIAAKIRLFALAVMMFALLGACGSDDPVIEGSPTGAATPSASPSPGATAASPTGAAPAKTAAFIPGLSAENASILDSCLAGADAACDRAQEPERLNDGHFSRINAACTSGNSDACTLKDRLVEAELRMHCADGDVSACVTPSPQG